MNEDGSLNAAVDAVGRPSQMLSLRKQVLRASEEHADNRNRRIELWVRVGLIAGGGTIVAWLVSSFQGASSAAGLS